MSSNLLPLRVLVKEVAADWCDLAGVETELRTVRVTDLDGRRADPLRQALRDAEDRVMAARDCEPTRPRPPAEWHELADRAFDAADAALVHAARIGGPTADPGDGRRHKLYAQTHAIIRGCITLTGLRQAPGFAALVESTEAVAESLRAMTVDAPPRYERVDTGLTVAQVAEHLGLSVRTVETYRADGRMPEPTMVGRTPTWTRAQIDQWQANRPGRGARTDLRGRD